MIKMLVEAVFAAVSATAALGYILLYGASWKAALLFGAAYVTAHVLLIAAVALNNLTVDRSRPLEKQSSFCRFGVWAFSQIACFFAGIRPQLVGAEKLPRDGRFVMVSNHRSAFDPLSVLYTMPEYNVAFISKPSNVSMPLIGRLAYGMGTLPIDRENDRSALRTILQAADYIKRDMCSMMIYPEGTRNKGEGLLPFHAGSFKLPQRAGVPLVILGTAGTAQGKKHGLRGRDVYLEVLETVDAETVKSMSTAELSNYAKEKLEEYLSDKEKG